MVMHSMKNAMAAVTVLYIIYNFGNDSSSWLPVMMVRLPAVDFQLTNIVLASNSAYIRPTDVP